MVHGSIVAMEIFDIFSGRSVGISPAQHVLIKSPELVHMHTNALFQYGLKLLSICDIIGVKHPTTLLIQSSHSITVPFEEYNSSAHLSMGCHFQVT